MAIDADNFWSRVNVGEKDSCWEWSTVNTRWHVKTYIDGVSFLAHRMAWELTNGPIPEGKNVLHKCDNPVCVNPDHLYIGGQSENVKDSYARKRRLSLNGERHPLSKLCEADVRKIVHAYKHEGKTQAALASEYGVCRSHVSRLVRGDRNSWENVER